MWNLTKEIKERFEKVHLLPIHETDEEWEYAFRDAEEEGEDLAVRLREELEEVKEELLQVVPVQFHKYIENGTLNQPDLPKSVREQYLQWVRNGQSEFEQILEAAYKNTQHAATFLPEAAKEVFNDSLHDSTVERIVRDEDQLHLYINTDGGFTNKALIHLTFKNIKDEQSEEPLQIGHWFVYDELLKTSDGFAFRVLFDCPETEWTIHFADVDAEYFHRPKAYTKLRDEEMLEETTLLDFASMLNSDFRYWLITPDALCEIIEINPESDSIILENGKAEMKNGQWILSIGNERFTYDTAEHNIIKFIYTDVYEDPYAQFSEPVPESELESAAFSEDLELKVRAWNTMGAYPRQFQAIINRVLERIEINEENEMMLYVFVSKFMEEDVLTEANIEKFRSVIE